MIVVRAEVVPFKCSEPDCIHCPTYQVVVFEHNTDTHSEEIVYVSENIKDFQHAEQLAKVKGAIWLEGLRRAQLPEGLVPAPLPPSLH